MPKKKKKKKKNRNADLLTPFAHCTITMGEKIGLETDKTSSWELLNDPNFSNVLVSSTLEDITLLAGTWPDELDDTWPLESLHQATAEGICHFFVKEPSGGIKVSGELMDPKKKPAEDSTSSAQSVTQHTTTPMGKKIGPKVHCCKSQELAKDPDSTDVLAQFPCQDIFTNSAHCCCCLACFQVGTTLMRRLDERAGNELPHWWMEWPQFLLLWGDVCVGYDERFTGQSHDKKTLDEADKETPFLSLEACSDDLVQLDLMMMEFLNLRLSNEEGSPAADNKKCWETYKFLFGFALQYPLVVFLITCCHKKIWLTNTRSLFWPWIPAVTDPPTAAVVNTTTLTNQPGLQLSPVCIPQQPHYTRSTPNFLLHSF